MRFTLARYVALAATLISSTSAIHLRIGGTKNPGKDVDTYYPVFNVYSDDWSQHKASLHVHNLGQPAEWTSDESTKWAVPNKFCPSGTQGLSGASCPYQVDSLAGYGFRVVQNGGSDHAIRVQSWHNHNGQELTRDDWCWFIGNEGVREGGDSMFWQCDFTNY